MSYSSKTIFTLIFFSGILYPLIALSQITADLKKNGLPIIDIHVNNGEQIVSKYEYLKGVYFLHEKAGDAYKITYNDSLEIKGRGNSTFIFPKRPFRLKLKKAAPLVKMPSNRHWALLANFEDRALTRTHLAMDISRYFNMNYTPKTRPVEVVVNAFHWGTYQLIEVPKIGVNRINIDAIQSKTGQVTGGVLFEFDNYLEEAYSFRTEKLNLPFVVKDPDDLNTSNPEVAAKHFAYAKGILQRAEDVLYADNFKDPINGYRRYFDINSLVNWYLIQELTKNIDLHKSSIYIYVDTKNENKLCFSPVWDFDFSMGNLEDANGMRAVEFPWMPRFMEDPYFMNLVKERYKEKREGLLLGIMRSINNNSREIHLSQQKNFSIWNEPHYQGFFQNSYPSFVYRNIHADEVFHLKKWLVERVAWMDSQYLDESPSNFYSVGNDMYLTTLEDKALDTAYRVGPFNGGEQKIEIFSSPKKGKLIIPTTLDNLSFSYLPSKNVNGIDSFYIGVSKNQGRVIDTSLITVTILPVNDSPEFKSLVDTLYEDKQLNRAQDSGLKLHVVDPDDSIFVFRELVKSVNGRSSIFNSGAYEYVPNANFFGRDSVLVEVSDSGSLKDSIWIYFDVLPVNDAPVFTNAVDSVEEDHILSRSRSLLLNATKDDDDSSFLFKTIKKPAHGSWDLAAGGDFTYKPTSDYFGKDSVCIETSDTRGLTDTGWIYIDVLPVNDTPVFSNAADSVKEDHILSRSGSLLRNAIKDVDDSSFLFKTLKKPSQGSWDLAAGGDYTYRPTSNYFGKDSVCIESSDTGGLKDTGWIYIDVLPVNDAPVFTNAVDSVEEDHVLSRSGSLLRNAIKDVDDSSFSFKTLKKPTHGSWELAAGGDFTYIPMSEYFGKDSVCIELADTGGLKDTGWIYLHILPVNDPPLLDKLADSVLEDESISRSKLLLLSKVNDVDDDHFTFKTIKQSGNGKWVLNEDGDFTYMPSKDYFGTDSVMIEVKDMGGLADTAWISLNVLPVNDPPVSLVDTIFYQIFQDESFDLNRSVDAKLVKDIDNTLNQLSIVLVDQPKLGNVITSQTPRLSYNAPVLKTGLDHFYVAFSDGIGQSKIIPFIIRVLSKKRNPLDPEVRVYPNPSRDFVQINNINADKWEIRGADGRLVMQSGIHHNLNHFSINLNSLPKGSYLLYLYKEKSIIVIKRIVLN